MNNRWLGSLLIAASLPACFSNNRCERSSKAKVQAALISESASPILLRWDDRFERPTHLSGDFTLQGADKEPAVRAFFRAHSELLLNERELVLSTQKRGLSGTYLRFSQVFHGLPVFRGEVIAHVTDDAAPRLRSLRLAQKQVSASLATQPSISRDEALLIAKAVLPRPNTEEATLGVLGARLVYRVVLSSEAPLFSEESFIDANTGEVVERQSLLKSLEGVGFIFDPNPVASSGNHLITDQQDATTQFLSDARVSVPLPGLDGSGFLRGRFADIQNASSRAQNLSLVFNFQRADDRFEEVMAYFHIDRAQQRIQSLGFFDVNNRAQEATVNAFADDNSFYNPSTKKISYGFGGVDDAEDADIIVHEYGHSVQDNQVPGFGVNAQSRAMGEGFSDYLGGSFMAAMTNEVTDPACIGDWDATFYDQNDPPCLRRLDIPKHFPEHMLIPSEPHADGEIWSAALFELRQAVGADTADTLIIEAHFGQSVDESFEGAATAVIAADQANFSGQNTALLNRIFHQRGILRDLTPPADLPFVVETLSAQVEPERDASNGGNYFDANTDLKTVTVPGAQGLRLRFAQLDTELNEQCADGACDNIYLFDKDGNLFQILNGQGTNVSSVIIPGDTVQIRLVSDFSQTAFGYLIDQVEVMGINPGPTCNNGNIEAPESCDGAQLQGATCQSLGFDAGALSCNSNCTFNASQCTGQSLCGNNQLNDGEECDGANIGGQTCTDFGFDTGNVSCNPDCTLNKGECSDCGDGIKSGGEACDGLELGGAFCEDVGLSSGFLRCSGACTFDTSACLPPRCD